jgi:hypothetical protein
MLASACHGHGSGHAALALLGSAIAARWNAWAAQSVIQAAKAAFALRSHLVIGVRRAHGDHACIHGRTEDADLVLDEGGDQRTRDIQGWCKNNADCTMLAIKNGLREFGKKAYHCERSSC